MDKLRLITKVSATLSLTDYALRSTGQGKSADAFAGTFARLVCQLCNNREDSDECRVAENGLNLLNTQLAREATGCKADPYPEQPEPMTEIEMLELEQDFCTAFNMMVGESHEQAQQSAKQWMKEARE